MDVILIILAAAGVFAGAALFAGAIERLMARLGVTPAEPAERSDGLRDVLRRIEAWQADRAWNRDR